MRIRQTAFIFATFAIAAIAPRSAAQTVTEEAWAAEDEVVYFIFVRSFRDSNGDRIGDLKGIEQSLDYLQQLGVTSLLLTPIQPSPFYHNYFATSFEGIDPDYGDEQSWQDLVKAVHARGMKIYLDVEIQYLAEGHSWWRESAGNPASRYSRFLLYHGEGNTRPESAVFGLTVTPTYDGQNIGLTTLNLREPALREYFENMLVSIADPNHDGRFEDGVDGFRIDHMMDDLDNKKIFTNLFADFWAPIFAQLRKTNPGIRIIAEQADWGFGDDFLKRAGVDMVFAFPLRGAIVSLKRETLVNAITLTAQKTPAGKGQLVFIENHDVNRYASEVGGDPRKQKAGAALGILLKGTPLLYYGQEIGMTGRHHQGWTADGSDIPDREAFEWTRKVEGQGAALWYKDSGPWWTERYAKDDDGISVEEQQRDTTSLLSFYQRLLELRRTRPELRSGAMRIIATDAPDVLAVVRRDTTSSSMLLVNLADKAVKMSLPEPGTMKGQKLRDLMTGKPIETRVMELDAYAVLLLARPTPGP